MKKDIVNYLIDSFTDYQGKEHKIVACALSESPDHNNDEHLMVGWIDLHSGCIDYNSELKHNIYRLVTIGIAICNPEDKFDEELGKKVAYNKAANDESCPRLYVSDKGIITQELVDAFLKQQVRFIKENPGSIIKGYKEAEIKYNTLEQAKKDIANFTDDEKSAFKLAIEGHDLSKYAKLAKIYVKKLLREF